MEFAVLEQVEQAGNIALEPQDGCVREVVRDRSHVTRLVHLFGNVPLERFHSSGIYGAGLCLLPAVEDHVRCQTGPQPPVTAPAPIWVPFPHDMEFGMSRRAAIE